MTLKVPAVDLPKPSSLEATDARGEAAANKGGGRRITLDFLKSQIVSAHYISGDSIRQNAGHSDIRDKGFDQSSLLVMTLCMLQVRNGFVVFGKSAPMSPQNFDPDLGRSFAYEDAVRQLWPLYAFYCKEDALVANGVEGG